jgi:hypothetical protein
MSPLEQHVVPMVIEQTSQQFRRRFRFSLLGLALAGSDAEIEPVLTSLVLNPCSRHSPWR